MFVYEKIEGLTKLENFVWCHPGRFDQMAAELNRSVIEIEKAYCRAHRKMKTKTDYEQAHS